LNTSSSANPDTLPEALPETQASSVDMPARFSVTPELSISQGPMSTTHRTTTPTAIMPSAGVVMGKPSLMDRIDMFVSRLSARNNFWQRVCSLIWMPYAFKSGIKMKRVNESTFAAVLPFRRFNRNWYNAMAGAALLGNSEIAGGMYVFSAAGAAYTVVCKSLEYKFMRPCFGPAVYKITPREDLQALIATGNEFNVTLDMEIVQQSLIPEPIRPGAEAMLPKAVGTRVAAKEKRVGRCVATFHVTPKTHQQARGRKVR